MKLAHYVTDGVTRVGVVSGGQIFDLQDAASELRLSDFTKTRSIDEILSEGLLHSLEQVGKNITATLGGKPVESVKLRSPILNPEKILMVAVNYGSHSKEQGVRPAEPYFFTKFRNTLIGPDEPILIPKVSTKVDWEAELSVIIGKSGKYISKKDAMEYVAGYTISNDISFRDFQHSTASAGRPSSLGMNWVKGKGLDSSFPFGPWLVTKDEVPNPQDLAITLTVNGQIRQNANTSDMIFKIDDLIEYVSAGMTLKPGDIISTGTPEGVAYYTGQPFLKDGDIVEARIDKIGVLRNPAKSERT